MRWLKGDNLGDNKLRVEFLCAIPTRSTVEYVLIEEARYSRLFLGSSEQKTLTDLNKPGHLLYVYFDTQHCVIMC